MQPSSSRGYWVAQLCGWGGYALINALILAVVAGAGSKSALAVLWSAVGLGLTHALRMTVGPSWSQRRLLALTLRVLGASVLFSVIVNALALTVLGLTAPTHPRLEPSVLIYVFNWSAVFLGWQLIYFGVQAVRRSTRAELHALQLAHAAQAAQLGQLKAQLNPHFLFNALNSLRALIAEDPARAQTAVTQLAGLLRYGLGETGRELVPLERELQVVRDYLALEGVRFEERLRVTFDVEEAALQIPVPVMLLQTLVENAVKHGVARLPAGGELGITAHVRASMLELGVTNPVPAISERSGGGIGLANSTDRLRLLFGDRASLQVERALGAFTARLRVPVA
jgi:two-component system sensor histidine kinase AlgZ